MTVVSDLLGRSGGLSPDAFPTDIFGQTVTSMITDHIRRPAAPLVLVVFGASGDLAARKLFPALCRLAQSGRLNENSRLIGVARSPLDDDTFRKKIAEATPCSTGPWLNMLNTARYVSGGYGDTSTHEELRELIHEFDTHNGTSGNRIFYLATPPDLFAPVVAQLGAHGLVYPHDHAESFSRVVIEKPYGHDLASAEELDAQVHRVFHETQIYRIDHYIGKETVQNVLALRFANSIFEPIWNRSFVDHVQITVAEEGGVGPRGGYYDRSGATRDFLQNHILQVLALMLMEAPVQYDPNSIRNEKVKALNAVRILEPRQVEDHVVRAQYVAGTLHGEPVPGYREEPSVDPTSETETYVAMRLEVDNWRWAGVPVYLRTGKRLPRRLTEVVVVFQPAPHLAFRPEQTKGLSPNAMIVRIQPDEGITLQFGAKVPGQDFQIRTVGMDFTYNESFEGTPPDAYERLLLDAMLGDPTLFIRSDEVEQAWKITDPLIEAFEGAGFPLATYKAGTWGPRAADQLLARTHRSWRNP